MNKEILKKYAELVYKIGVNLQKGQGVEIDCSVENAEVAEVFTEVGYKLGAKLVNIRWNYDKTAYLNYKYAETEALAEVPEWFIKSKEYLMEKGFCRIAIDSEDPFAFKDIPAEKLGAVSKARSKALKKYSDCIMSNGIRWCVVSVPSKAWAEKVFPNDARPEEKLFDEIIKTMRLNCDNPIENWENHIAEMDKHAKFLNDNAFEYLHYENSLGTDIYVGLADDHVWLSAQEEAKDGVKFVANIPTEEVFTCPHKGKINGKVYSALPLSYNGQIIDKFSLTFKDGKIVDYSAETGYDALKSIIETDEGTLSIGEAALIGKNSPIAQSGILFYNTLFDENASCHLAIGKAYPTTFKNGDKLSEKELSDKGANDSIEHVDFMIGTPDLKVTGIRKDKSEAVIFTDGEWAI